MTIHELLQAAGLTANDEIPIWDVDGTGEPTKKVTAQQLAAAVVALANLVTGVKGNTESSYRTGNVNITPANIGAVATSDIIDVAHGGTGAISAPDAKINLGVHVTLGDASWSDVYTRLSMIDGGQSAFFWITTAEVAQFVSGTANMAWTSGIVTNIGNGNFRFAAFLNGTLLSWNITGLTSTSGTVGPITQNVTGVKGNTESTYRTGNVNLTAANIGAAPIPEGVNLPFTGSDDLNDSPAGWSICNEVTDAAERANAHMPFQSWCYICTISSSTAGSEWKTQMAFPWYKIEGPAIRRMDGNGTWTEWAYYYGQVSKIVTATTDANGNVSLDLNQQSYVVTAVKVPSLIATPWGGDYNWHARITDLGGSAYASQSVTATVYYHAV